MTGLVEGLIGGLVTKAVKGAVTKAVNGFVTKGEITAAQAPILVEGVMLEIQIAVEEYTAAADKPKP